MGRGARCNSASRRSLREGWPYPSQRTIPNAHPPRKHRLQCREKTPQLIKSMYQQPQEGSLTQILRARDVGFRKCRLLGIARQPATVGTTSMRRPWWHNVAGSSRPNIEASAMMILNSIRWPSLHASLLSLPRQPAVCLPASELRPGRGVGLRRCAIDHRRVGAHATPGLHRHHRGHNRGGGLGQSGPAGEAPTAGEKSCQNQREAISMAFVGAETWFRANVRGG